MRRFFSVLLMLIVTAGVLIIFTAPPALSDTGPNPEEIQSLEWLRAQIVPNTQIPAPTPQRRGLMLSYAAGTELPSTPAHRKCFVYDAAVASIAFGMAGDWSRASMVLQALARAQRSDGSFWFSYNVENTWPEDGDHDMAIVRAGATAWVGYAFAFYVETRPAGTDARLMRERASLLDTARRVADFLLTLRVTEKTAQQGLLRGGRAFVKLQLDAAGTVTEVYDNGPVLWVSTEHNISSYFFLTSMHRLTGNLRYAAAADAIRAGLMATLWQPDLQQFAQGVSKDGSVDRTQALDCASWGALFLLATGETEKAELAVKTADRVYANVHNGVKGYRPYDGKPIYDNVRIQRVLLPETPRVQWQDFSLVWSEGTLGVALAHARLGHTDQAGALTAEMLKLRDKGGIRYSSRELPYEMSASPSIAGTAWHVIMEETLRNPHAATFWSR
ncbi:MAG TPA: hypothetical protein VJ692_06950 [Nitrospiraceae bacterium]|nr:hypothetical protein [Nitrospiraceae bacterium]